MAVCEFEWVQSFWRIWIGLAMVDLWIIFNNFIAASISGPPVQLNLTEHIEPPNVKKKIFSNSKEIFVHFWFMNSEWGRYRGFLMTIQPNGKRNIQWILFNVCYALTFNFLRIGANQWERGEYFKDKWFSGKTSGRR